MEGRFSALFLNVTPNPGQGVIALTKYISNVLTSLPPLGTVESSSIITPFPFPICDLLKFPNFNAFDIHNYLLHSP